MRNVNWKIQTEQRDFIHRTTGALRYADRWFFGLKKENDNDIMLLSLNTEGLSDI